MDMKIIGIDIGGTYFRIGTVCDGEKVTRFQKVPTASVIRSDDVILDMAQFIQEYIQDTVIDAVVIGFPATLDRGRRKVMQAPNLEFMEDLPVVDGLGAKLGVPVLAERDVTMALYYDVDKYGLSTDGVICGIYFGTGIGNAIMIDGKPLSGKNGAAGEIGHIPVIGSQLRCGCGNEGCVENLAAGKYLVRLQQEHYPQTPVSELFARHGQEEALREFVDRMAAVVAAEINILDPDHMLLGGGVVNMTDFPRAYLQERIVARTRKPYPARNLQIIYTEDEPEKSVVGAAIYAGQRVE